ncbi:hypothetical protein AA0121_g10060 [Alternaria tenuissima]|uniref:Uncharacterized protein n=1 Tax=Alternaria tenuissima TaxID=119927 RepID=A0AB37W5F5_9PLEO|nr:hypothetical protein AA0115_g10927 [Alternaria tenuissima]RYO11221.1 hypothetical protein AA0121_g10060 [Alternaria tenuissima]
MSHILSILPWAVALEERLTVKPEDLGYTNRNNRRCDDTGKVVTCRPLCECYDVWHFAATLTPLSTLTSVASTASSTPTSRSTSPLGTSMTTTSQTHHPTQGTIVPPSPSSGLSTGAKAGIGVGAVVGGAAIFDLLFWLAWVLRKRRIETAKLSPGADNREPEWKDFTHGTHGFNQGAATSLEEPVRLTGR